jgi:AcrR family transcriptional regulator
MSKASTGRAFSAKVSTGKTCTAISPKTAQKQSRIVWALYECLADEGHENITVKDIAARAGMTPGIIHYYFESKDAIVAALAKEMCSHYRGLMEERLACEPGRRPLESAIDFLLDEFIFAKPINRVFYNLVQMAFGRETLVEPLKGMLETYRSQVCTLFSEGLISPGPQAIAAVALFEGLALQWMIDPGSITRTQVKSILCWFVDSGFLQTKNFNPKQGEKP